MRVYIKYITEDENHTVQYFTVKLDKNKHKMSKESFMEEVLEKVRYQTRT